jgi:hypothetical protein
MTSSASSNGSVGAHPHDDLAVYALDALDDAERVAVDDHLAGCGDCRSELDAHRESLAGLTTDEAPPAAVWSRIATTIGAPGLADPHRPSSTALPTLVEATSSSPATTPAAVADPAVDLASARATRRRPPLARWLATAAACLAIGGLAGYVVGTAGQDGADDIGSLAEQASEAPDGVLATLDDTTGQPVARVVTDEDGAYILLEGLSDLPRGRAYQLWSLTGPDPVSLGMLGRDGSNTVAFRLPPTITDLAISVEPTSGEVAPTGSFEASGQIQRSAVPS